MRLLVTGGAGFIGSHLVERLLGQGHEVLCLDSFATGREKNLEPFRANRSFELIRHDVVEPIVLDVERVYHLACSASPVHHRLNPITTLKTSVIGTLNMLDLCKRNSARMLHTSTSEVYGDPEVHPQREDYWGRVNPIGPRSCYDEGKRVAETLCFDYNRQSNVDIRVVRIFNTYGPRMQPDDGRVVSAFVVQALRGEDLTLYGDGSQTRSLCYVDDLVEGLVLMMDNATELGPVNLGRPEEITMAALASTVIDLVGSKSKIVHRPLPVDDPARRCPDIGKARRLLGWEPTTTLKVGLEKTILHFDEVLRDPRTRGRASPTAL